jgi:glucokinase
MIGAVDIGGTKIAVGMVDDRGKVRSKTAAATGRDFKYSEGLERASEMLRQTARQAQVKITGIGIGSTGPVDPFSGEFGEVDFLPHWRGKNPVKDLARIFKVKVALENDADAGALAEAAWGAGKKKQRLIYITIGTGIGGAVVLDGKLYRGVDGAHPEFGHQVIDPSGPLCSCGVHGCWEALAAGPAMVQWLHNALAREGRNRDGLNGKDVCEMARAGDALAMLAVERETRYLGLGLANLVNLFVPDVIVLGGSVMKSAVLFLEGIRETIVRNCRFVPFEKTEIALASLGEDSNLIGAARVWQHRFGKHSD